MSKDNSWGQTRCERTIWTCFSAPPARLSCSDTQLLRLYQSKHDQNAFIELVARHGLMVFTVARRYVKNSHDAEDVWQTVFQILAHHSEQVQGPLALWLSGVARHSALTQQRTARRRQQREERALQQGKARSLVKGGDSQLRNLREELAVALRHLPGELRQAVELCYLQGRRQEEAAQLLGCNQGTLSRRVAQGLKKLQAILVRRGVLTSSLLAVFSILGNKVTAGVAAACLVVATSFYAVRWAERPAAPLTSQALLAAMPSSIVMGRPVPLTEVDPQAVIAFRESAPKRLQLLCVTQNGVYRFYCWDRQYQAYAYCWVFLGAGHPRKYRVNPMMYCKKDSQPLLTTSVRIDRDSGDWQPSSMQGW
jgi:RNA polymerase sigma factor (sigma-70 family)